MTVLGKKLPSQGIGGVSPEFVSEFSIGDYRVGGKVSSFDNALNFSRTGPATYVDATGTLQTAADGVPRDDHHIWDGSAWVKEMRFESDAATNNFLWSSDLSNAAWSKIGLTVASAPLEVGPDGKTGSVYRISGSDGNVFQSVAATGVANAIGFWVKSNNAGSDDFRLRLGNDQSDVITATTSWARVQYSTTPTTGVASLRSDGVNPTDILVWNPQTETGSFLSSDIITEATTAIRNAETLTASAGNLPYNLTAVSIQMEGTMSYADEGDGVQTLFARWLSDGNNSIQIYSDTASTNTGRIRFRQAASGVISLVSEGGSGSYTPGVNVPFNIASRHGSTFINGAVDGTALTANTTPTALPDLTATDLEIAPNFNGTIKRLRIWGSDIGDTGIAAASD